MRVDGGRGEHAADGLHFRLLGGLEVWSGATRIALGGAKAERVLAALLLDAGRVVPVERLITALWDGEPPRTAVHQVRKSIAELRCRIPEEHTALLTDGRGYRAELRGAELDLHRFDSFLDQAGEAARRRDTAQVVRHLRAALALFRGEALTGLDGPLFGPAAAAIEERRVSVAESLCTERLALGEAALVITDLRTLIDRHPLRESLRHLLMLALCQSGRQAEALTVYGEVRLLLADELGVDPGAEITQLYTAILRGNTEVFAVRPAPATAATAQAAAAGDAPDHAESAESAADAHEEPAAESEPADSAPAPHIPCTTNGSPMTLPYDLDDFTGRSEQLRQVRADFDVDDAAHHLLAIDGMGGSGKTALAVHAAHQLGHRFPDGQLFVDLHGFTPGCEPLAPEAALDLMLRDLGIAAEQSGADLAGRSAAWRTACGSRRLLILLDNASDESQVIPLLPSAPGCLVIVTSRRRLVNLDGARELSLTRFSHAEGVAMVEQIVGTARAAAEPEAVDELVRLCCGLPLALRIAAARLRHRRQWTVRHLVERLSARPENLAELSVGERSVANSLSLSYQALGSRQRQAFRLLGAHPGPDIDTYAAAELFGCGFAAADRLLEALLDVHLLEQHELGRFSFHDLVRDFAQSIAETTQAAEDGDPLNALLDYYGTAAERAADRLFPGRIGYAAAVVEREPLLPPLSTPDLARNWFDRERANLMAVLRAAARHGLHRHAAYLPRNLGAYLTLKDFPADQAEVCETSVTAARQCGDLALLRLSLTNAGLGYWLIGMYARAIEHMEEALQLAEEIGDACGQAACLSRLGSFHNSQGRPVEALRVLRRALSVQRELGDRREEAMALNGISATLNVLCRHDEALAAADEALEVNRELGFLDGQALAQLNRAEALLGAEAWDDALERLVLARDTYERLGHSSLAATAAAWQAYGLSRRGHRDAALTLADQTCRLARDTGSPARRAAIANLLGWVYAAAGRTESAAEQYATALRCARLVGDAFEQALAIEGAAAVSAGAGDKEAACEGAERAASLYAQVGTPMCCRRPVVGESASLQLPQLSDTSAADTTAPGRPRAGG